MSCKLSKFYSSKIRKVMVGMLVFSIKVEESSSHFPL